MAINASTPRGKIPFKGVISQEMIEDHLKSTYDRTSQKILTNEVDPPNGKIDKGLEGNSMWTDGWGTAISAYLGHSYTLSNFDRAVDPQADDSEAGIDIEDFSEWYVKKYDLNSDDYLSIPEQIIAKDEDDANHKGTWMVNSGGLEKYRPHIEKLKMFDEADGNHNGILEKDLDELGKLLRLYEKKYPSDNSRAKNNSFGNRWGYQWFWDPSYVGTNALSQFRQDTTIYFFNGGLPEDKRVPSDIIDSYVIKKSDFIITIGGQGSKLTWTPEELFRIA